MKDLSVEHSSHQHPQTERLPVDPSRKKIVLVGNPNVGKSVVFNYLSGLYVDVSNFPGTTIEISKAAYLDYELYDTPGIYGVSSFNDEERVARDIILNGEIILNIVDALHLERDLFLTQQLIDMGKPVGVIVNMMDEARKHNIRVDTGELERRLGVPVVPAVAVKKQGLDKIHDLINSVREGRQHPSLHSELHRMLSVLGSQAEALMVLEGDAIVAERHGVQPSGRSRREELYIDRRNRVNRIIQQVVHDAGAARVFSSLLGRWSVSPLYGIPILLLTLYVLYLFVGVFIAQDVVGYTENTLGRDIAEFHIKSLVASGAASTLTVDVLDVDGEVQESRDFTFPDGTNADKTKWKLVKEYSAGNDVIVNFKWENLWIILFFGEFGAVTMTLTYLLFLLLPLVAGFYFALSILEDSGYLPRLATLVDRSLRVVGLNGRAIIPMILGFGCVTMATITTRLLGTQREKTIATTILQLAIPCSAQLGVIAALLATAGLHAALIYGAVILGFLIAVGSILNRSLPGETSPLLIDLPPLRLPRLNNVLKKTGFKTYFFMKEATPWFFIGAMVVGILQVSGMLVRIQGFLEPVIVSWMKLPAEASTAFVMGLVRRDFGAAGLYHLSLSPFETVVALVTITLFVPCVASLMVMLKERGLREGAIIWMSSLLLAVGTGGVVAQILL